MTRRTMDPPTVKAVSIALLDALAAQLARLGVETPAGDYDGLVEAAVEHMEWAKPFLDLYKRGNGPVKDMRLIHKDRRAMLEAAQEMAEAYHEMQFADSTIPDKLDLDNDRLMDA